MPQPSGRIISNGLRFSLVSMFRLQGNTIKRHKITAIAPGTKDGEIDFLNGDYTVVCTCTVFEDDKTLRFLWDNNSACEIPRGDLHISLELIGIEEFFKTTE